MNGWAQLAFRLPRQTTTYRDAARTIAERPDGLGDAEVPLTEEQLAKIEHHPAPDCERCHSPFDDHRYLLEITGHYVSGTAWELCTACTGDVYAWLGGAPDVILPRPYVPRAPRQKHQ